MLNEFMMIIDEDEGAIKGVWDALRKGEYYPTISG